VSEFVEWVQCKSCGRRHRWQAEIAGRQIRCDCGSRVFIPEVDVSGEQADPDATIVETVDSPTAVSPGVGEQIDVDIFGGSDSAGAMRRMKGSGLFGLGAFGEVLVFFCFALVGFVLFVHAVIVQTVWYIVLTVLITPVAFWKFNKKRKSWQGNRSLSRALRETIDTD